MTSCLAEKEMALSGHVVMRLLLIAISLLRVQNGNVRFLFSLRGTGMGLMRLRGFEPASWYLDFEAAAYRAVYLTEEWKESKRKWTRWREDKRARRLEFHRRSRCASTLPLLPRAPLVRRLVVGKPRVDTQVAVRVCPHRNEGSLFRTISARHEWPRRLLFFE